MPSAQPIAHRVADTLEEQFTRKSTGVSSTGVYAASHWGSTSKTHSAALNAFRYARRTYFPSTQNVERWGFDPELLYLAQKFLNSKTVEVPVS